MSDEMPSTVVMLAALEVVKSTFPVDGSDEEFEAAGGFRALAEELVYIATGGVDNE